MKIGYLPHDYAKMMVDKGKLPEHIYSGVDCFRDENTPGIDFDDGAFYSSETRSPWEFLADQMGQGEKNIYVGMCSDQEFCYWEKR